MSTEADSFYRPPGSDVSTPSSAGGGGGSIGAALAGEVDLPIGEVMGDAWRLVRGSKTVLLVSVVIYFVLAMIPSFLMVLQNPDMATNPERTPQIGLQLLSWVVSLLTYPLMAGMMIYAIKRAADDGSAGFSDVFQPYTRFVPLVGVFLLQGVIILLGILLLVLPGIYLSIAYLLSVPLLLDKELGVWEALETSRKAITKVWFRFFFLVIAVWVLAYLGSLVTIGIGAIWLVPWAVLCTGVTYYRLFGHGPETRRASVA